MSFTINVTVKIYFGNKQTLLPIIYKKRVALKPRQLFNFNYNETILIS